MDPHLERLERALAAAHAGMTAEQLSWHPPGKWCAAEVLEHLYLTYTGTTKGFSRLIEAGKPSVSGATWRHWGRKMVVLGFGHLPSGREAPAFARPRGLPTEKVVAEMRAKIAEMDDMIARSEQRLGRGRIFDHPILGPLSGAQWRKFHLVHGLHHVKQIRQLRKIMNSNS